MASHEDHIARIIADARECLTAAEITHRLNAELNAEFPGGRVDTPYKEIEVKGRLEKMPNIYTKGDKYCLKREDASQAAARIVREATEKH
jgi:hypothetical protein